MDIIGAIIVSIFLLFSNQNISKSSINTANINKVNIDQIKLTNKINDWELKQGYKPYIENEQLCSLADKRLNELKNNYEARNYVKEPADFAYNNLAENLAKDYLDEEAVLNGWLQYPTTKKNLTDYFKYSCIRCKESLCIQIFGNLPTSNTITNPVVPTTATSDPVIACSVGTKCGTLNIKRSECLSYEVCCQLGNSYYPKHSVEECQTEQNNYNLSNKQQYVYPTLAPWPTYNLTPYPTYSYQPKPTLPHPTDDPRCSQANNMWIEYRNDFYANEYNNYNNSAEAMIVFENQKQYIQNLINSYGCSLTLR